MYSATWVMQGSIEDMIDNPYEDHRQQRPGLTSADDSFTEPFLPDGWLERPLLESPTWLAGEPGDGLCPSGGSAGLLTPCDRSHSDFADAPGDVEADEQSPHEGLTEALQTLVQAGTPLSSIRMEYLDPYVARNSYRFQDGTRLRLVSADESAQYLSQTLRHTKSVTLLGFCRISENAYALTFAAGDETIYMLADHECAQ